MQNTEAKIKQLYVQDKSPASQKTQNKSLRKKKVGTVKHSILTDDFIKNVQDSLNSLPTAG